MKFDKERKELIYWANLLNQKGFVTARSGNISSMVEDGKVLITSHDSYLGHLEEKEVILLDLEGKVLEGSLEPTSEKSIHLSIYNKIKDAKVVIHSHSPFSTAFFHYFDELDVFSFEARFYLGKIPVIPQETPTVTDLAPVISNLENNNLVVLKNHGVIAVGKNFKEAFSLIELLEEQARINLITKCANKPVAAQSTSKDKDIAGDKACKLLSSEHMRRLEELVNGDEQAQELGQKYDLTCTLAVKNKDTDEVMCFHYEKGKIAKVDRSEDAEFMIIGDTSILKNVFNRKIDPFVALTQGKVKTKGNFTKMSKWYPVMVRTFKLWEKAPVE